MKAICLIPWCARQRTVPIRAIAPSGSGSPYKSVRRLGFSSSGSPRVALDKTQIPISNAEPVRAAGIEGPRSVLKRPEFAVIN
jgi:hypothetical protein